MLQQTDRLALAVPDADKAAAGLNKIFDSIVVGDIKDNEANARRVTLQWGCDQLELFEPKGSGPVADFISSGKRGIFAGGFALQDPAAVAENFEKAGIKVCQQGDRFVVYPQDLRGTGVILSPSADREHRTGLMDRIWQITYTVPDLDAGVAFYSKLYGIEEAMTNHYSSKLWGYHAAITWFEAYKGAPLDSLAYLDPFENGKAAGRFLAKTKGVGGIYMATVHTPDLPEIKRRIDTSGGGWEGTANEALGFIHPRRTFGLLLGVTYFDNIDARRPTPEEPDAWNH